MGQDRIELPGSFYNEDWGPFITRKHKTGHVTQNSRKQMNIHH